MSATRLHGPSGPRRWRGRGNRVAVTARSVPFGSVRLRAATIHMRRRDRNGRPQQGESSTRGMPSTFRCGATSPLYVAAVAADDATLNGDHGVPTPSFVLKQSGQLRMTDHFVPCGLGGIEGGAGQWVGGEVHMNDRMAGKVAVVTGAASGMAEATARRLVAEGARVVIADINEDTREGGRGVPRRRGVVSAMRRDGRSGRLRIGTARGRGIWRIGRHAAFRGSVRGSGRHRALGHRRL